ncbi:T9SS type A sorting domain-containing protein [bacterium]|nr:T9SS type A sorting domain-containing protein [bacterium]
MRTTLKFLLTMLILTLGILPAAGAVFIEKNFIGVGANEDGLFTIGVPDSACPDNIDLTCCNYCGGGGTGLSHVIFKIDDQFYSNDPMLMDVRRLVLVSRTTNILDINLKTEWLAGDLQITQILVPLDGDSTGSIRMQYTIANMGSTVHEVGLLLNLDLKIGNSPYSDMARFYFPTGEVIDTTAILEGRDIPIFWDSFDPMDSSFTARAILDIPPNVKPDRLAIGQAHLLTATIWEPIYIPVGDPYDDSGIIYWWYPQPIPPGGVMTIITTLGRGPGAVPGGTTCNFIMNVQGARRFNFHECELFPNPFSITLLPINVTLFTADSVYATIEFTDTSLMRLIEGDVPTKQVQPPSIGAGLSGITYWVGEIINPPMSGDIYAEYTITMTNIIDTCDSETLNCLVHDTCFFPCTLFVPTSTYEGPVPTLVEPLMATITTNPYQKTKIFMTDAEGVDTNLIWLQQITGIDTLNFDIESDELDYINDTIIFTPPFAYSDGNRPRVQLLEARDIHGCVMEMPVETRFLVDRTPPICRGWWPETGDTLWDSLIVAWMHVYDNLGYVDTESVDLGINLLSDRRGHYSTDHGAIHYAEDSFSTNDTLYMDPLEGGVHWLDGVVKICRVYLTDHPDYGIPNAIDDSAYCFFFTINAHGPRAHDIQPRNGDCTSNPLQPVIFDLFDGNGIIASTVRYSIQGETFMIDGEAVDSIMTWTPTEPWEDMEVVEVSIWQADDSMHVPIDYVMNYSFIVDLSPPYMIDHSPAEGETVGTVIPMIYATLGDLVCGVDPASIIMDINGSVFDISDDACWFSDDTIYLDMLLTRWAFETSDTVEVCITVSDAPAWGEPNTGGPFCWTFFVEAHAPQVLFLGNYLCAPAPPIYIKAEDPDGVETSSIRLIITDYRLAVTDTYDITDPRMTYTADSLLTFTFSGARESGDSFWVCLDSISDIHGFTMESPLCEMIYIDLDAPFVDSVYTDPEMYLPWSVEDTMAHLYIDLGDATGFIDPETIILMLNGVEYDALSGSLTLEEGHIVHFNPTEAGITYADDDTLLCILQVGSYCDYGSNMIDPPYNFWLFVSTEVKDLYAVTPYGFELYQNYPNPFNSMTNVVFTLSEADEVTLEIYDILGRAIKTLVSGQRKAGIHMIRWEGTDDSGLPMPTGVYFMRLSSSKGLDIKRMWLLR